MHKYRVLKSYPKQITNSGRLITIKKGAVLYLKSESQVIRLVRLGFIKPEIEVSKNPEPIIKPANKVVEDKSSDESKKQSKAEWLNRKNKSE